MALNGTKPFVNCTFTQIWFLIKVGTSKKGLLWDSDITRHHLMSWTLIFAGEPFLCFKWPHPLTSCVRHTWVPHLSVIESSRGERTSSKKLFAGFRCCLSLGKSCTSVLSFHIYACWASVPVVLALTRLKSPTEAHCDGLCYRQIIKALNFYREIRKVAQKNEHISSSRVKCRQNDGLKVFSDGNGSIAISKKTYSIYPHLVVKQCPSCSINT